MEKNRLQIQRKNSYPKKTHKERTKRVVVETREFIIKGIVIYFFCQRHQTASVF